MENQIGQEFKFICEGIATLVNAGVVSPDNQEKFNVIVGKVLDKLDQCVDSLNFCDGGQEPNQEQPKQLSFVGMCCNLYGSEHGTDGMSFEITVDGEMFVVNGSPEKTGVDLHVEMANKLTNNQKFGLSEFRQNGSETNYFYTLFELVPNTLVGKPVTMSVTGGSFGNITINGTNFDQKTGTGQFILSN